MRKVLSLFNGISGLHLALDRAEIKVEQVYYAEIDKFANKVTEHHYPKDIPLGDVTKWKSWKIDWENIDLVTAGFPCQSWSVSGQQLGDKDERGALFWTTLDIIANVLKHNPKAKFLLENVKMKKDFEDYITNHTKKALGYVEKTLINSALVSAQNRNRFYWTNFKVADIPKDKNIMFKDIMDLDNIEKYKLSDINQERLVIYDKRKGLVLGTTKSEGSIGQRAACYDPNYKIGCLTATMYKQPHQYIYKGKGYKISPLEAERLQTVPDNFTDMLSNTQRYKCLGNGWTIDVIAYILKNIKD